MYFCETDAMSFLFVMVKAGKKPKAVPISPMDRELMREPHRIAVAKYVKKKKAEDPEEWKWKERLKKRKQRESKEFRDREKSRAIERKKEKKAYEALRRRVEKEWKEKSVPKRVTRMATMALRSVGQAVTKARIQEFYALTLGK